MQGLGTTPQGVRTTLCSECREDWVDHVLLAKQRAVDAANAGLDLDEYISQDVESYIKSRAEVTHRECVTLLLRKHTGPPGPQGAMGSMGLPGEPGISEGQVKQIAREVVEESYR